MALALQAAAFLNHWQWQRWHRLTAKPWETQKNLFLELIGRNRHTLFGREHRFETIKTVDDYRRQVPVSDYERYRPYIERAKNGEVGMLTSEPVLMFTMTSGTTSEPKLIPVTWRAQVSQTRLARLWYYRAFVDHRRCFSGKLLGVVNPAIEGYTAAGIPYGSASGLIYRNSPWWTRSAYVAPYELSEIEDFHSKYYVLMRLALEQNVSFLGTPNPSTILRLVEIADHFKENIIRDIADGALSDTLNLPRTIRERLSARLSKNRERAKELEKLTAEGDGLRPRAYWPRLQLIGCWKGGTVGVRLAELNEWFRIDTPLRDLGYMASEAHMSLPIIDAGAAGILALDANFYEFIPQDEMGTTNPTTLTCDQLQEGGVYYVVITTAGGLYRYDINDLIRVTGLYRRTPMIEFLRKGRDVTSLTGEKLHVNQVIQAMDHARRASGVSIKHYRAVAEVEKNGYAFMLELDDDRSDEEQLARLLEQLDHYLGVLNIEYLQKRRSRRLAPPVLHVMRRGWFERNYQARLKKAGRDTQFKALLLSYTPEESSEILLTVAMTRNDKHSS